MSSTGTGSGLGTAEAVCTGLVRRMLNLPRTIQRAVDQGLNLTRPTSHHRLPPPHHSFGTNTVHEEWAFLAGFEQGFGMVHPIFYACRFVEALKMARDEHKLVFMYLHAPTHPSTPVFCRETLCSEVVVQFLDANFVSWGGLVDRGDGLHMATTLRPAGFPFCAVVVPTLGDGLIVAQRMEGPVSTAEMVEILQRAVEEQGSVSGGGAAAEEGKRRSSGEDDDNAAYFTSLHIHQMSIEEATITKEPQHVHQDYAFESSEATKILVRFPNGERKEKGFASTDKVQAVFKYVDSIGSLGLRTHYKLVSSFPKKVYGVDQMEMTLKDAGLHPKATLFIELV